MKTEEGHKLQGDEKWSKLRFSSPLITVREISTQPSSSYSRHHSKGVDILTDMLCIQFRPRQRLVRAPPRLQMEFPTSVPKGSSATATQVRAGFGSGIIS